MEMMGSYPPSFFLYKVYDNLWLAIYMYFQDEHELDEQLPSASSILGKRTTDTVIDLSDDDVETSADRLEPVFPVIPPTSFYSSQSSRLEEFRCIREEQDAEYKAMLENDLALENVCVCIYIASYNHGDECI